MGHLPSFLPSSNQQSASHYPRGAYVSTSIAFLQRNFDIGYARAARFLDTLQQNGVIEAGTGTKPRKVINGGDNA
jgi:DNA segregation ATPase FtsK/SpoIIIE-like protein